MWKARGKEEKETEKEEIDKIYVGDIKKIEDL